MINSDINNYLKNVTNYYNNNNYINDINTHYIQKY
jgi:hypothetical protein